MPQPGKEHGSQRGGSPSRRGTDATGPTEENNSTQYPARTKADALTEQILQHNSAQARRQGRSGRRVMKNESSTAPSSQQGLRDPKLRKLDDILDELEKLENNEREQTPKNPALTSTPSSSPVRVRVEFLQASKEVNGSSHGCPCTCSFQLDKSTVPFGESIAGRRQEVHVTPRADTHEATFLSRARAPKTRIQAFPQVATVKRFHCLACQRDRQTHLTSVLQPSSTDRFPYSGPIDRFRRSLQRGRHNHSHSTEQRFNVQYMIASAIRGFRDTAAVVSATREEVQ